MGKALLTNQYTTLWMRGTFNKNGTDRLIQLYVQRLGDEFNIQQYSSASDNTGVPLQVHRIKVDLSRQLISRVSEDQVAIDLPRDFLDARKDQGLDIRLIGYNNVSLIVKVPAAYIAEFLLSFPGLETGTN